MIPETPSPWNGLVEQRKMLVRVLRRRCADQSVAEDLAHETLLRAVRYRKAGSNPDSLRGWLYGIAGNVLNDHVTRTHRGPKLEMGGVDLFERIEGREPAPGEDAHDGEAYLAGEASLCREEALHHTLRGMHRLNDRDRRLITATYVSEIPRAQLPPELALKHKGRLYRARRRLRREVARCVVEAGHRVLMRRGVRS